MAIKKPVIKKKIDVKKVAAKKAAVVIDKEEAAIVAAHKLMLKDGVPQSLWFERALLKEAISKENPATARIAAITRLQEYFVAKPFSDKTEGESIDLTEPELFQLLFDSQTQATVSERLEALADVLREPHVDVKDTETIVRETRGKLKPL